MPNWNIREVQLKGLDSMVVPLDCKQFAVPGHAVSKRRAAAAGEERYHGGRVFRLRLEVLLPAGLEECRIVFYFGKVCPHFGQVAICTSSAADSSYSLNSTSFP